jgi:hypothetical protein
METWYFSPFPKEYYADGVLDTVGAGLCDVCTLAGSLTLWLLVSCTFASFV